MYRLTERKLKPIGWGHFAPIGEGYDIIYVYVEPEYRRQGIAREMILAFIKRIGPRSLMLEVRKSNESAIGLYKGLGFEIVSERKGYYRDGEDALVMKKENNYV